MHKEWKKNWKKVHMSICLFCLFPYTFLVTCMRLYRSPSRSIHLSVRRSVSPSVSNTFPLRAVYALPPLPNHMRLKLSCIWHPTLPLRSPLPPLHPWPPSYGKTAKSKILSLYTEMHHWLQIAPTKFQDFKRSGLAPMTKRPDL